MGSGQKGVERGVEKDVESGANTAATTLLGRNLRATLLADVAKPAVGERFHSLLLAEEHSSAQPLKHIGSLQRVHYWTFNFA